MKYISTIYSFWKIKEKRDIYFDLQDIDECGRTSGVCSNGVCENMMGAYQCVCDEGFKQVSLERII